MSRNSNQLTTRIAAVDNVSRTLRRTQGNISRFSRQSGRSLGRLKMSFGGLRTVVAGAVAALTTGAIARGVHQFASAGDEIAKMSRELGLGAEALQEFRFAADRQGVSTEDLEKSLGALNNRVGQLRNGQGSLHTALSRSNPELAEQVKNAGDTEEAFMLMMEALNQTENAADRAALAQAAFGRSGQTLVRMAEAGAGGLEALRQEARSYGNIISDEAAAGSESFVDAVTNLKNAALGLRNKALAPLVATFQPLVQRMAQWVSANQDLIQQKIARVFGQIRDISQTLAKHWKSGLIPAILAGVVALKALLAIYSIWKARTEIMAAVQLTLNMIMAASPIYLIIAAIAALVAATVWMVRNWEKVIATVKKVWNWFSALLDNPLIAAALTVFAPFITIPALIVKHWGVIKDFFVGIADAIMEIWERIVATVMGTVEKVTNAINTVRNLGKGIGERIGNVFDGDPSTGLFGANDQALRSSSEATRISRSEVDINVGGLPRGSSVQQRGRAPGVSLAFGREGGQL